MRAASLTRPLPLAKLRPGKNPRGKRFSVDDLVQSLGHAPLLQNIVVRRLPGPRDEYEVVAGHRRYEAAKRLGWSHIEAKIVEVSDEIAEAFALEENLRRKALPDEPTALARLLAIYEGEGAARRGGDRRSAQFKAGAKVQTANLSAVARAARATGQSETDVRRKARIGRRGSAQLRTALARKQINILEADKLASLPRRDQELALATLVETKHGSDVPKDIRRAIDALAYVEKVLGRYRRGEMDREAVRDLRRGLDAAGTALGRLDRSRSTGKRERTAPDRDVSQAVRFEPISMNRKLGPVVLAPGKARPHFGTMRPYVASTLVSIQATCPDTCVFKGTPTAPGGCYVDAGFTRIAMQKLDGAAWGLASLDVVKEEVRQIDDAFDGGPVPQDGARGGRDLRLHVGGDVEAPEGARLLALAARRWRARGGGTVWTYTHAWREVPRSAWGESIAVLASVEEAEDIPAARRRGYAAALVVERFPEGGKAFLIGRTRVVPCPAETRRTTCVECRLCLDRDLHSMKVAISFKLHGQHQAVARLAMTTG